MKNDKKETFGEDESKGLWKTILLIIFTMLCIFLALLFAYNKLVRR
jgi:hypothetical protein